MSQQPPYGAPDPEQPYPQYQQPYQQPYQQAYTPYSQGGYPNPYAQQATARNHTTRNVLLIIGVVVVLFCGGIVASVVWVIAKAENAFDTDYRGSDNDPITVAEGDAFSIRGFDYDEGWRIIVTDTQVVVDGLRVTNDRDDEDTDSVYLHLELYRDNVRLAPIYCSGGGNIGFERSAVLSCSGSGDDVGSFDEIEVYDSSAFE